MDKSPKKKSLTLAELNEAEQWVEAHKAEIPLSVYRAVLLLSVLRLELSKARQRATNLLALFRRELGVIPSSESGTNSNPNNQPKAKLSDEDRLLALKARRAKLLKEIRRYEDRLGKGRKKRQKCSAASSPLQTEAAEPAFQLSEETVFSGNLAGQVAEDRPKRVDRVDNFENPRGLHAVTDERTRHEHSVTTKTIRLSVETVTDPRTGKSVTANTEDIGQQTRRIHGSVSPTP